MSGTYRLNDDGTEWKPPVEKKKPAKKPAKKAAKKVVKKKAPVKKPAAKKH